jgi:TonB-dependent SusC/RagA subfamily outer membrane receptor
VQHPRDNSLVVRKAKNLNVQANNPLNINVLSEKETFKKREQVTLTLKVSNPDGTPAQGSFSISVVDAIRQIQNPSDFDILSYSSKTIDAKNRQSGFFYEKNPLYMGIIKNQRTGKIIPEANLVLMLMDSTQRQTRTTQGNANGRFVMNELLFEGEKTLSYQVNTKKGKAEFDGLIEFDHITNNQSLPPINSERTTVSESTQNEWKALLQHPDGEDFADPMKNILLEEVAIKAEKPKEYDPNMVGVIKLYNEPDFSVSFDDKSPRFTNVYEMMIGSLPGVQVASNTDGSGYSVVVRGVNSLQSSTQPLFIIDGMPISGDLSTMVSPNDVVKIDVLSGASAAIYGSNGANGVIAIYTRRFGTPKTVYPFAKTMKMKGFQIETPFKDINYATPSPDHKSADNRVGIYWKPDVITNKEGEATITFFTADIAGIYNIVVEGMTLGNVGKGVKTIAVK